MRKNLILILSVFLLFTGCIELTETIHFNKDGSGTAKISVVSFAQLVGMSKEDLLELKKTEKGRKQLSEMDGILRFDSRPLVEKVEAVKSINGVSNVKYDIKASFDDSKNDVSYVSFDFASVKDLNDALVLLYNAKERKIKYHKDGTRPDTGYVTSNVIKQLSGSKRIDRTAITFFYEWDGRSGHFSNMFSGNDYHAYLKAPYNFNKVKLQYNYSFDYEVAKNDFNTIAVVTKDNKMVRWVADTAVLINSPFQVACSFNVKEEKKASNNDRIPALSEVEIAQKINEFRAANPNNSSSNFIDGYIWKEERVYRKTIVYKRNLPSSPGSMKSYSQYLKEDLPAIDTVYNAIDAMKQSYEYFIFEEPLKCTHGRWYSDKAHNDFEYEIKKDTLMGNDGGVRGQIKFINEHTFVVIPFDESSAAKTFKSVSCLSGDCEISSDLRYVVFRAVKE